MNHYETEFLARQRIAELTREADQERLAKTARAARPAPKVTFHGLRRLARVALPTLIHDR